MSRFGSDGRDLASDTPRAVLVVGRVEHGIEQRVAPSSGAGEGPRFSFSPDRIETLHELEEEYITWVIEQCGGNKTRAAEVLGVDTSTLHRRIRSRGR